jgi:hypothetical protein
MKNLLLLLTGIFTFSFSNAQVISDQVDLGAGYVNQVYYHFNGTKSTVSSASWDLGFCTTLMDAAVISNPANVNVYRIAGADSTAYPYITDTAGLDLSLQYNSDTSWFKGAFNRSADPMNPFDFGWGLYDFATHKVLSTSLFIVQKGNDFYKFWIRSKEVNGDTHLRYAKLDGSPDQDLVISTAAYAAKNFVYLSLGNPTELDLEPASADWQLCFTRYITDIPGLGPYPVTGALTNLIRLPIADPIGTKVAEARHVDLSAVSYADYENAYTTDISEIGYDWKYFDMNIFQYVLVDSLIYYAKTPGNSIYSIRFVDFNSTDGIISFETEQLLTAIGAVNANLTGASVYPNPATDHATLVYDAVQNADVTTQLFDFSGREVYHTEFAAKKGFNTLSMQLPKLAAGMYQLVLRTGTEQLPLKIMIAP